MLSCPFCGASETDRFDLEGRRFLVFACMFSPEVDPHFSDAEVSAALARDYSGGGTGYFRRMCDRLHLYVAAGEGAERLQQKGSVASSRGP